MSVARVYANINTVRPKEYWDYESLAITWGCVVAVCPRAIVCMCSRWGFELPFGSPTLHRVAPCSSPPSACSWRASLTPTQCS
jgi:hypothetical protein